MEITYPNITQVQIEGSRSKLLLGEVCYIRLALILFLVLYHCFCPFLGYDSWSSYEEGFAPSIYRWIGVLSYNFFLQAFVFVSGYLIGSQYIKRGGVAVGFNSLVVRKFKRLMIPSLIFSFLYLLLFRLYDSPQEFTEKLIYGAGHMWFLPMLFCCFIGLWILEMVRGFEWLKVSVLVVAYFSSFVVPFAIPSPVGFAMQYMVFFYAGYLFKRSGVDDKIRVSLVYGIGLIVLAFSLLILTHLKAEGWLCFNGLKLIYCLLGVAGLWFIGKWLAVNRPLSRRVVTMSGLCMGVYLFQQFIIKWIYYHTPLTIHMNPWLVPWLTFVVTLSLSLILTWLCLKTRLGRSLFG